MASLKQQEVTVSVGTAKMPAYLAAPNDGQPHPGVVVFQEIFGVNREMRRIADLLANSGYVALVPNFYHRTAPNLNAPYNEDGMKVGLAAAGATTLETLFDDAKASIAFLKEYPGCNGKIGAWGFCFGGTVAYLAATLPDVKAAVSFYGGQIAVSRAPQRPAAIEFTKDIKAPILLSFGGKDQSITSEHIAAIEEALKGANRSYQLEVYPEEGHGYFRHGVNGESTAGARDVWPKVKRFLAVR
jgi:carboxymethylenebutenolidase